MKQKKPTILVIDTGVESLTCEILRNYNKIDTLVIPESVHHVDESCFALCPFLNEIHLMHKQPSDIKELEYATYSDEPSGFLTDAWSAPIEDEDFYEGLDYEQCKLYVPQGSEEMYRQDPFFSYFSTIIPESKEELQKVIDLYNEEANEINKTEKPVEYFFFWGHTEKPGRTSKACLSQWYPCSFKVDGITYDCAEQYMMAQKAILFGDKKIFKEILQTNDPKEIKALGRKVRGFNEEIWNQHCCEIVRDGNLAKFTQNEDLKAFLTKLTGNKILVEASPYDTIWGIGMKECPQAHDRRNWKGQNKLGFILTEVRRMIASGEVDCFYGNKQELECLNLNDGINPESGWAIVFAGGSASGKSTLINNLSIEGYVLSTDTFGEEYMEVHNKPIYGPTIHFTIAEKIVKAGMYSRYPQPYLLNKVQNIRLDFDCPTVSASTLSALLSNGAHKYKESYFKENIDELSKSENNVILDMTGKEREVNLYTEYLKEKGYKVALIWVVTNRNVALLWNAMRRRRMKISGVHAGHNGPNKWLLEGLQDGRCDMFDDAWIVFNSTESINREMSKTEKEESVVQLHKEEGHFVVPQEVKSRIEKVLGPNRANEEDFISSDWIQKFFLRYRMIKKTAQERGIPIPDVKQFLVSFMEKDKDANERKIKDFYSAIGCKEPKLPKKPYECYDVIYPSRCYFGTEEEFKEAVELYPAQKAQFEKSKAEWENYNRQFEPNNSITVESEKYQNMKTDEKITFKYDFSKNPIEKYSKKIQEIDETIRKAEAADVTQLEAFFNEVKRTGLPICFYGAGGAASPASFASQLANEQGIVAMTYTPMAVMTLSPEVVKKMLFLAISASGGPVDMQAATEYLMGIAPERVYCLTTNAIDHINRFGKLDNKVGQMVNSYNPEHAICVNLSIHSDGFVGTNKHVGLSLLLYRSFYPEENEFASKLLLPEVEPYYSRLPEGMTLADISDLHILYGAMGRSAANDMEGRMLEAGVIPAMATDLKNFTHGRHVFLDKHNKSTILMLISPRDEEFVSEMLKLIPKDRPLITIRTTRNDILGALQLMICTFYLSIDICALREINPFSPGAPKWGGKLWALKIGKNFVYTNR